MIRSSSFGGLGQPPAKQPFSFGGASSSQTQAQSQQQQQPATGAFSFGQSTTQQPSSTTNNAAGSSSLFGAPKPAATAAGFSFGAPSTSQQQPQQQQSNPAPALGSSLFGGGASTSAQQPTSLFGQQPQQQQQQQQQAAPSFGASTSLFGQQQQQPQGQLGASTSAAGPSSSSPFSRHAFYQKERFNDLPDDARKLVEEMDALISSHVAIRDEVHPKLVPAAGNELAPLGQQIHAVYAQLHDATVTLSALQATVEYQQANVRNLASSVEGDRRDFVQLWEIGDAYRQSQQQQQASSSMMAMQQQQHQQQQQLQQSQQGQGQQPFGQSQNSQQPQSQSSPTPNNAHKHRQFLSSYFARSANDFMHRVQQYRRSLDDVSRHLASLSSRDKHSPRAISDTIYFQHETFMGLAAQVAGLHAEVEG